MKYFIAAVIITVMMFIYSVMRYTGAFLPVTITQQELPAMKMIAKDHVGPFHKIVAVIQDVEKWAKENGIDCTKSFGQYLDNPEIQEEERLKSRGGCIVNEFPKELPEHFQKLEVPAGKYVVATFEGAPSIGPMKVYPKVVSFFKENRIEQNGPVIEVYVITGTDAKSMITTYLFPAK